MKDLFYAMDKVEVERKRRIVLTMAAYAYEIENTQFMDDLAFDAECQKVDPSISTGNEVLDKFFREEFDPSTGNWITVHPDLLAVKRCFENHYRLKCDEYSELQQMSRNWEN